MSAQPTTYRSRLVHWLGPFRVLSGNTALTLLFSAHAASTLIDWLYALTLFILAYDLTHSATVVGILTAIRLLPYGLVAPFAGALSDRLNRKTLLIAANVGRALCVLALVVVHSRSTLLLAFPLVFIVSLLGSVLRPTVMSLLPDIVHERELVEANSVMSEVDLVSFGAGPALAALILTVSDTRTGLIICAAILILAAALVEIAHLPTHTREVDVGILAWFHQTVEGVRFTMQESERLIAGIAVTLAGLTLWGGAYWAISLVLAEGPFGIGGSGIGFINASYAFGGIVGGFLVGPLIRRRESRSYSCSVRHSVPWRRVCSA